MLHIHPHKLCTQPHVGQQRQSPTETARVRPPWTEPSPKRAFRALLASSSRAVRCLLGERLGLLLLELGLAWRLRAALPALPALPGVRPRLLLHRGLGDNCLGWPRGLLLGV